MKIKPKKSQIETQEPFFKIEFGCSNRAFCEVKSDVVSAISNAGLEPFDGYFSEKCDYEGDLEEIIVYRGGREESAAQAIIALYGLTDVPDGINIHLSMY